MSRCGNNGIQLTASWVPANNGVIPSHAVSAGHNIFVARARFAGDMLPGKVARGHSHAYVPHGGAEHQVYEYEVLCNTSLPRLGDSFQWRHGSNGHVPHGALVGGHIDSGEPLYVARANISGEAVVGKVASSHGCAFFPYGGQ